LEARRYSQQLGLLSVSQVDAKSDVCGEYFPATNVIFSDPSRSREPIPWVVSVFSRTYLSMALSPSSWTTRALQIQLVAGTMHCESRLMYDAGLRPGACVLKSNPDTPQLHVPSHGEFPLVFENIYPAVETMQASQASGTFPAVATHRIQKPF